MPLTASWTAVPRSARTHGTTSTTFSARCTTRSALLYRAFNGSARSQGSRTRTYRCAKCKLNCNADMTDELDNLPRRRLPRAEEDSERERLRPELDAISTQDEPPKQIPRLTGRTCGDAYAAMTQIERIGYIRSGKFKVVVMGARRDVHIEQE